MAKQYKFSATRPADPEPIEITLDGGYQSDPGNLPDGTDWRDASWEETFHFVRYAPWSQVNAVIASVAQDNDGNLIVAGGLDLSRFLIGNAVDADQRALRELLNDRHRVVDQKVIAGIVFALVGEWGGKTQGGSTR